MGSAFGALAGCLLLVFRVSPIWLRWVLNYVILNSIMLFIAISITGIREWIRVLVMSYLISFIAGGIISSIAGHLPLDKISVLFLMSAVTFVGMLFCHKIKEAVSLTDMPYDVSLTYRGNMVRIKGIYDTGNRLEEPITKKSVSLCEFAAVKALFTAEEIQDITCLFKKELKSTLPLYMIPYHAVGTKEGLLVAVAMDEAVIHYASRPYRMKNPLVALYMGKISADTEVKFIIHKNWRSLC